MSDVIEAMCRFLGEKTGAEDVTDSTTFDSLDMDSLVLVELAVVMERRFVVSIPDGDLVATRTVGEAAALVDARRPA